MRESWDRDYDLCTLHSTFLIITHSDSTLLEALGRIVEAFHGISVALPSLKNELCHSQDDYRVFILLPILQNLDHFEPC